MDQQTLGRKIITLSALSVVGIVYKPHFHPTLTADFGWDHRWCWVSILVLTRLPICRNAFTDGDAISLPAKRSLVLWLSLNVLVLFVSAMAAIDDTIDRKRRLGQRLVHLKFDSFQKV
jgi:hypothetical protein